MQRQIPQMHGDGCEEDELAVMIRQQEKARENKEKRVRRALLRARAALAALELSQATGLPYKTPPCIERKSNTRKDRVPSEDE